MNQGSIMLAATGSGCGKTTITCGLLSELVQRNMKVHSFKCGPDYIDPMFHRTVIGAPSYNLDSYFLQNDELIRHYRKYALNSEINVIEGVMGYYDGAGYTIKGSSYEIASILKVPVILILNGNGMANSILATIKGFLNYQNPSHIEGVIINRVSEKTYFALKDEIEAMGVKCCGYVPKLKQDLTIKSRHLGLLQADEVENLKIKLEEVRHVISQTIDMEMILSIARSYGQVPSDLCGEKQQSDDAIEETDRVRVAIAMDEAFSFIYQENMDILRELGCELIPFSPIHDRSLPQRIHGIILMGGYPEMYAKELSENQTIINEIKTRFNNEIPLVAECGGYLYLKQKIEGMDGTYYPMVGVLPGESYNNNRLSHFGYVQMCAQRDSILGPKGINLVGHEFHYWESADNGDGFRIIHTQRGEEYPGVFASKHYYAGFPHLYYPANRAAIAHFVHSMRAYKRRAEEV